MEGSAIATTARAATTTNSAAHTSKSTGHGRGNAGGGDRAGASPGLRGSGVLGATRRVSLRGGRRTTPTEGSGETRGGRRHLRSRPRVPGTPVRALSGGGRG